MIFNLKNYAFLISTFLFSHFCTIYSSQKTTALTSPTNPGSAAAAPVKKDTPTTGATAGAAQSAKTTNTSKPLDSDTEYHDCDIPTTSDSKKETPTVKKNLPTDPETLGTPYPLPTVPPQTAKAYAITDIKFGFSDEAYVLGLIANGTYALAYAGTETVKCDEKLPGRNSAGLLSIVTTFTTHLKEQAAARTSLLQQQRTQGIEDSCKVLSLLGAINQQPQPKKIDMSRIEEEFKRIETSREALKAQLEMEIKEAYALDEILKETQKALHDAHLTGDKSLPLSPRKEVSTFTQNVLTVKK